MLLAAGLLLMLAPPLLRSVFVRGDAGVSLRLFPGDRTPRLVATLVPESDGCLIAAGWLSLTGGLRDPEGPRFHAIMAEAYARLAPGAAAVPTPAIATYLGLQTPSAFDTIVIEPDGPPRGALVFLHGYAGNFYVYCWEIAQAASQAGLITLCPSVSARGAWWNGDGERTFRATLQALHARGIPRVVLGGLSNGGVGASAIAQRHARELAGLVLISGVGGGPPAGLPTLIVQGTLDRMMPAARARAFAGQSRRVRYRELQGGHLIFLSQQQKVRALIADFLRTIAAQ
ncbi:MAG TPA: hypothetical protein VFZ61_27160 [Polyangiales bacterium]